MWRSRYQRNLSEIWKPAGAQVGFAGQAFTLLNADFAALRFLRDVSRSAKCNVAIGLPPLPLYALRAEFREVIRDAPIGGLIAFLRDRPDPRLLSLTLWLLGQCRSQLPKTVVAFFDSSRDVGVRKEAARALYRLGAWTELRSMAEREEHPAVRRFSELPAGRLFIDRMSRIANKDQFPERMARFVKNVSPSQTPPPLKGRSRMAMFWFVLPARGKPPKSAQYIRMILERIRALLHPSS